MRASVEPLHFRALKTAFPSATTFFVEGTCIAAGVRDFFGSAAEPGPHLPARQTLWPRPQQFRLPAIDPTLRRLMDLAASPAEPELLDRVLVQAGAEPLIEYQDAFVPDIPIFVSRDLPEPRIRWFARELRLDIAAALRGWPTAPGARPRAAPAVQSEHGRASPPDCRHRTGGGRICGPLSEV
jgi:hypothetical protein